jgi:MazG family protein
MHCPSRKPTMTPDRVAAAVHELINLVARLRGPDGCPWDRKQTEASISLYLLEEAYEVVDAIERAAPEEICGELGDLFFQIVFLAQLGSEKGAFDFLEVTERIIEKMIRRHPHVFGDKKVENAEDVASNWAEIKRSEQGASALPSSSLDGVPSDLPALLWAHRLSERASKMGFDWQSPDDVYRKVLEEMEESAQVMARGEKERVSEELGDLLFSMVNLARHLGFNAESVLRRANRKFLTRFKRMETRLNASGVALEDATSEVMDRTWETIKSEE